MKSDEFYSFVYSASQRRYLAALCETLCNAFTARTSGLRWPATVLAEGWGRQWKATRKFSTGTFSFWLRWWWVCLTGCLSSTLRGRVSEGKIVLILLRSLAADVGCISSTRNALFHGVLLSVGEVHRCVLSLHRLCERLGQLHADSVAVLVANDLHEQITVSAWNGRKMAVLTN